MPGPTSPLNHYDLYSHSLLGPGVWRPSVIIPSSNGEIRVYFLVFGMYRAWLNKGQCTSLDYDGTSPHKFTLGRQHPLVSDNVHTWVAMLHTVIKIAYA
jgi:hypothetical protein